MIIALFGNLCDRSDNDLERMDVLRGEIKEAERERDEAREEASNWRKLFFKVNSIGGTSTTKGVTGLLGDVIAHPRNLLLQHQKEQNSFYEHQQRSRSTTPTTPTGNTRTNNNVQNAMRTPKNRNITTTLNKKKKEKETDENEILFREMSMPTEEECEGKSFDEIFNDVSKRMEFAAAEERRVFEEKKRQKMIDLERRKKVRELEGISSSADFGVASSSTGEFDDEMRKTSNILTSPSGHQNFESDADDNSVSSQGSLSRAESLASLQGVDSVQILPQLSRPTSSSSARRLSISDFAHQNQKRSKSNNNYRRKSVMKRTVSAAGFSDDDDDEYVTSDIGKLIKKAKPSPSRKKLLDEVELEREAVFQWINDQFDKRSHAAYDLYLAAERHKEIIEKYEQESMTSALGDLPIEDDADALQAELAQQPKSIYQVLVGLLTDVHGAVQATDNLSERMKVEGLHLKHPERSVNVAVRRWRRLAQEIGRFRTENGKRAPIENLKVEFAQLPNPSVVDILFTLVEISSTLSEMSLRLKAAAEAKVLDRVLVEPPVPPEKPEDPCPLCNRVAPPPASWGITSTANNNLTTGSGKDNIKNNIGDKKNSGNNNTNNINSASGGLKLSDLHSSAGLESNADALRRERLGTFLASGGGLAGLGNNNNNNNNASSEGHQVAGDLISNLGLGKYDSHSNNNNSSPIVIELKINCSCCAGGTRPPKTDEDHLNRQLAKDYNKMKKRIGGGAGKSSRKTGGYDDDSYSGSSSGSSLGSSYSSFSSRSSSNSASSRGGSNSSLESDWKIVAGDEDVLFDTKSTRSIRTTKSNKSRHKNDRGASSPKDGKLTISTKRHPASSSSRRHRHRHQDSSSRGKSTRRDTNKNSKSTRRDDDISSSVYAENAELREMKALAREMEQEEQKAADALKNRLRGATAMPDFIRRGSMNLGRGDNDDDDDDFFDEDDHLSVSSRGRRHRHRHRHRRHHHSSSSSRKHQSSAKDKNLLNDDSNNNLLGSRKHSVMTLGSRRASEVANSNNALRSSTSRRDLATASAAGDRRKSTRSLLSDSEKSGTTTRERSSFMLSASQNTAKPANNNNNGMKRKMSTFSEYSIMAPPSIAGTTRPGYDDDDDDNETRRPSVNSNLSRKNTGMIKSSSSPKKKRTKNNSSSSPTMGSRRRSTIKSSKSFFSDGSGEGFISGTAGNKTAAPSTVGEVPPHRTKSMISSSKISNSIGKNNNNNINNNQQHISGGFIGNARQKYPMFAETRCAKLLFLAGMELNAREEKAAEVAKNVKTGKSATVQESIDAKITTWPLELLLQNIHECYEFFLQHGAGKAKELGEFIAGSAAQKEKLSVALKPATMMESCEAYADCDERVMNFTQHVIGTTNAMTLRMILTARDKLRLHHTQRLIDVDPELPTKVQITKALRVSDETFDFGDNVYISLKEDLLRNCVPKLSSTDVQIVLDAPDSIVGGALETALGDRFVPLHLVHTIWRELLVEESAMFKEEFLRDEM